MDYDVPPPWSDEARTVKPKRAVYNRTRWTRDGARLYVVEGYDRSLIGDEEIEAAARWLADREAEDNLTRVAEEDRGRMTECLAEIYRAKFQRLRDGAGPDQLLGQSAATRIDRLYVVEVVPGLAIGYQVGQDGPCWRWPDKQEGAELLGRAVQEAMDRLAGG